MGLGGFRFYQDQGSGWGGGFLPTPKRPQHGIASSMGPYILSPESAIYAKCPCHFAYAFPVGHPLLLGWQPTKPYIIPIQPR